MGFLDLIRSKTEEEKRKAQMALKFLVDKKKQADAYAEKMRQKGLPAIESFGRAVETPQALRQTLSGIGNKVVGQAQQTGDFLGITEAGRQSAKEKMAKYATMPQPTQQDIKSTLAEAGRKAAEHEMTKAPFSAGTLSGGAEIAKKFIKPKTVEAVKKIASKNFINLTDDVAGAIAKEKNIGAINKLLSQKNPLIQETKKVTKDTLIQEVEKAKAEGKSFDEFVKSQTNGSFGVFKIKDIGSKREVFDRFTPSMMKQKGANGLSLYTGDKMRTLNFHLKQAGHKGVSYKDFDDAFKLEEIIDNDLLFKKYPSLKEKKVIFADFHTPKKRGLYSGDTIFINSKLYNKYPEKLQSTIVHEIQHVKQDIKGMAKQTDDVVRGHKEQFKKDYESEREIDARRKQAEFIEDLKTKAQLKNTWNKSQPLQEGGKTTPPQEAFGAIAGVETDEQGNISFDPVKAGMGIGVMGGIKNVKNIKGLFGKKTPQEIKYGSKALNAKTELIDRYSPIESLTKGAKLPAEKDPYVGARLFAGHYGKIQNRLDDLSNVLKPAKKELKDVKELALLERYQELSGRGISKLPGGISIDEVLSKKEALEKKLGDKLPFVKDTIEKIRGYSDNILKEAKDAGVVSESAYNAIKKNNQKYIPLQRLEYLAEQGDTISKGSDSFSVATQNLIKTIKGSEKEVADPIESMVRNTYKAIGLIERNKVATQMADLASDKTFDGVVSKLKGNVPAGMDKFSVFRNGIKEEYVAPKEVVEALKGLNKESTDLITKLVSKTTGLLRQGATSSNLAFMAPNVLRDVQTAALTSKVGFTPVDFLRGLAETVSQGKDYKKFLESGASFSGFFEKNKAPKQVAEILQGKGTKVAKTILNPLELIRLFGETTEQATRVGVFKRALKKGLSEADAAFTSRNATVDFAKSGNTMKVFNQWVPFLNARLQGTINSFGAIKNRPASSALKLSAIVAVPAIATYLNNTRNYKDVWNNISQTEKDNNFILIYGDEQDEDGRYTKVAKIPKGDIGRTFGNPIENYMEYLNNNNPKTLDKLALQIASDVSPVSFEKEGEFSGGAIIGGVTPPTLKAGIESVTNKNLYTGRDIVPFNLQKASPGLQSRKTTSPFIKAIGEKLNISPAKIENAIGTQFGGLGRQVVNPASATGQVSGRFSGARGGEQNQKEVRLLEKLQTKQVDEKILLDRDADLLFNKIKELPSEEKKRVFIETAKENPKLLKKVIEKSEEEALGVTYVDRLIKGLNVENGERADYIASKISGMEKEEKKDYLKELARKKVISEKVLMQVIFLEKEKGNR